MTALLRGDRRPAARPARRSERDDALPRTRQGSPSSLLLTLFGDYWFERPEPLPSAAIVALLGDFGVSEAAARAALSRMVKHRLLLPSRAGRNTGYRLTGRTVAVLRDGLARMVAFRGDERAWDGEWRILVIDDTRLSRSLRDAVRSRMEWLGFAQLLDGIWLSPWERHVPALDELGSLGVVDVTTLTARVPPGVPGGRRPEEAWDLVEIDAQYRRFVAETARLWEALDAGALEPADALVARTKLTDEWLALTHSDPDLPAGLLPPDWPRTQARAMFVEIHETLGALATERVMEALRAIDPTLADLVVHRSLRDLPATRD